MKTNKLSGPIFIWHAPGSGIYRKLCTRKNKAGKFCRSMYVELATKWTVYYPPQYVAFAFEAQSNGRPVKIEEFTDTG